MGESQVEVIRPSQAMILWGYDSKRTKAARLDMDLVVIQGSSVAHTIGGGSANHPVAQGQTVAGRLLSIDPQRSRNLIRRTALFSLRNARSVVKRPGSHRSLFEGCQEDRLQL